MNEKMEYATSITDVDSNSKIARMKEAYSWLSVGLEGGIGINIFSQDIEGASSGNEEKLRKVFESGTGIGEYLTLVADFGLSYKYGLQLRVGHQNLHVGNSADVDNIELRNGSGQQVVSTKQKVEWEFSGLSYLTLGLNFRVNTTPKLAITMGASVHVLKEIKPEIIQTNTIISPENVYFDTDPDNSREVFTKSVTQKELFQSLSDDMIGVNIGVSYRFNLMPSVVILPQISYQHFMTKLFNNYSKIDNSISSIQIGVAFRYNL